MAWGLAWGCQDYGIHHIVDAQGGDSFHDTGLGPPPTDILIARWCDSTDALPDHVGDDQDCLHVAQTGPIEAVVEWSAATFSGYGNYNQILMAPMVGQLTDDDGDGDIDRDDTPDIVTVADDDGASQSTMGVLRILSGDGSGTSLTFFRGELDGMQVYPYRYTNVALGDVDADGDPEIVLVVELVGGGGGGGDGGGGGSGSTDTSEPDDGGGEDGDDTGGHDDDPVGPPPPSASSGVCGVAALSPSGEVEWVAPGASMDCSGHAPALADLDGDGLPEVLVGPWILNGKDGSTRGLARHTEGRFPAYSQVGTHTIAADLDMDGILEVIVGGALLDPNGKERCMVDAPLQDGFTAAADFDGDGNGEVVLVGNGSLLVYQTDCTVTATWALEGGGNGGPPTVADFDADGTPEIGVAGATLYSVYEADGSLRWSAPITDASSHATGSSVFDFEADGRPEVVYGDETRLWIFDGPTGNVRLEDATHASRTLHEYPTIADVDGDGHAEIVVPQGGGHQGEDQTGLMVLGGADGGWVSARQVWNQHAYAITNINDDLTLPAPTESNWPEHNNFRSGDVFPLSAGRSPNAVPLVQVCVEECDAGRVELWVRVGNEGASGLRSVLPVTVYADDGSASSAIDTLWTDASVPPGAVSGQLHFEIPAWITEDSEISVVVDDNNGVSYVPECVEDDNAMVVVDAVCP